jgi:hypothetical protein
MRFEKEKAIVSKSLFIVSTIIFIVGLSAGWLLK